MNVVKRVFDFVFSVLLLVVFAPLFFLISLLVLLRMGRPVFFRQTRPGLFGMPFEIIKFRTMSNARGSDGDLLPDEVRLTGFGMWLRSTSLDELPELWNVIKGDMSLVGPRPLMVEYLPHYDERQARRHEVRPGITGWAQVSGRNAVDWATRLEMDVWYVENRSIFLDLRILLLTVWKVLTREGVTAANQATCESFVIDSMKKDSVNDHVG